MLYQFLKPIVYTAVRIFYKKIVVVNREQLNQDGPTLIVSNHNNAFLDALLVAMFARPKIYSIARGDIFKRPVLNAILTKLCIIPIFRKEEGLELMHKNEATFEKCIELLSNKQTIIMYPEGDCITEKRLRKLRKGAARIALRAEAQNKFELDVKILPVGLNYSAAKKFRSSVFINVGQPLSLKEYKEKYAQDSVKAINQLTNEMEGTMRQLIVDLQLRSNDGLYEDLLKIYKPQLMYELHLNPDKLPQDFKANCEMANAINYYSAEKPELIEKLKHKIRDYMQGLQLLNLSVNLLNKPIQNSGEIAEPNVLHLSLKAILLVIGMPFHLLGLLFNYAPYRLAYRTADKMVKQPHFHASVNFVIGMFGWIFYYLFQLGLIALIEKNNLVTLISAIAIPALGLYSLEFYSFLRKATAYYRFFQVSRTNKPAIEQLIVQRNEILQLLQEAQRDYCAEKK